FTGKYDLTINGGQGGSVADAISIDVKAGGLLVTYNGEPTQFDQGVIRNVIINTGAGSTNVVIEKSLPGSPVTINCGTGTDTINITPTSQDLHSLGSDIQVTGGPGTHSLFIHDEMDSDGANLPYAIGASVVQRGFHGIVSFTGMTDITLNGSAMGPQ